MRNKTYRGLITMAFAAAYLFACKTEPKKSDGPKESKQSFYNNLTLDKASIEAFLNRDTALKDVQKPILEFYENRYYQYAWFDTTGLGEQGHNFMNLLDNSVSSLQDSSLINPELASLYDFISDHRNDSLLTKSSILRTELLLTSQFFKYAAKTYKGADIDASKLGWFIPRKKLDLAALLDSTLRTKAVEPSRFAKLNAQYNKLDSFLVKYNALKKDTLWNKDTLPLLGKLYIAGKKSTAIPILKRKLFCLGDLDKYDTTRVFDTVLVKGIKKFQQRMGWNQTGTVTQKMLFELNDSLDTRIKQILINMERSRWMPQQVDSSYIWVNIPEYKLRFYDSCKVAFDMRVIVGSAVNNTVIFSGNLKYIVFSPYWNVPRSIVDRELTPSLRKDPLYLKKHKMEKVWKGKTFEIRQLPGPQNSLGLVKFLFPNNYQIYLHDTPNHDLFSNKERSLSHGCIRLGDPTKMASYLLRNDKFFTPFRIDSLMHLKKEKWVTLNKPTKVYIVYFTSWVDNDGLLNFRNDIYGHDEKIANRLFTKK